VDELSEKAIRRFSVNGAEILLARSENQFYALSEKCTHRGGPLSEGTLEDGVITCPWHFGLFDLKTGSVVGPPPFQPVQKFEVSVENGAVFVSTP
jgi:nitrite reductase/ring-hydroxylating ferredoxin subunit